MSDSILPKIFEGFPELANQAANLETALDDLARQIDAQSGREKTVDTSSEIERLSERIASFELEQQDLRNQIAVLEEEKAALESAQGAAQPTLGGDAEALQEEVAHWKSQYDALASRFDEEIAAAQQAGVPEAQDTAHYDEKIAILTKEKESAAEEISRLSEALSATQREAESAKNELATAQQAHTSAAAALTVEDDADLLEELESLQAALDDAETVTQELEVAKNEAEARASEAEEARTIAAERLEALIDSLSAVPGVGAA